MLTDSELTSAKEDVLGTDNPFAFLLEKEYAPWISSLIRSEADARLLLIPIRNRLPLPVFEELVDLEDGSRPSRIERIEQLLGYWDSPSETQRLAEAIDHIGILLEAVADLSSEWCQPAYDVLDAIACAASRRIQEHEAAHQGTAQSVTVR